MARTGYLITVYQDINPSSPTYNYLREEKTKDETNCPVTPPTTEYRWVVVAGQYECVGYDKYSVEKKQQSTDGGTTWTDVVPLKTKAGSLIQANSEDCGYVPPTPGGYSTQYLTFEAVDSGTIEFAVTDASRSKTISYSLDNGNTWTDLTSSTSYQSMGGTLNAGDKVLVKGTNSAYGFWDGYNKFGGSAKVNVYGNIMSLIYGDNFVNNNSLTEEDTFKFLFRDYTNLLSAENLVLSAMTLTNHCYQDMFYGCTSLTTAPALPARTLSDYCYWFMFYGCTSLTTAPALPATTLATYCYGSMFSHCTSLTTAPELPVTTLANDCYTGMFNGCTSLATAPELPATTLTEMCYFGMFDGCTSLATAPELPATTLANNCYAYMFNGCTSLATAPELPVTTLADACYGYMFQNCTSLTSAPVLPATTLAEHCYQYMFKGCTSLTTAPALPATTLAAYCYQYMFQNCTSLTSAPVLPATTLRSYCYICMFYNCIKINYIKAMFTTEPGSYYTKNWVSGVASTGTFVKNNNAEWNVRGVHGIPTNWTVINE